ncbi:MAG: HVO_0476 family zinc finger protein [Candidatus Methanomethylophilaceae archaeon]
MREIPDAIYYECPKCNDITLHEVLKGKMGKSSLEATLRCEDCQNTFNTVVKLPKIIKTKVVVSDGPVSESTITELEEGDKITIDDEFFIEDGRRLRVCAIELENGRRVKKALAENVRTLWAKQFGILSIKVTVNNNRVSYSRRIEAEPDDEFTVGQMISLSDMDCYVHAIKTRERLISRGDAEAREIVRIYGKLRQRSIPILDIEEDDVEDI